MGGRAKGKLHASAPVGGGNKGSSKKGLRCSKITRGENPPEPCKE